MSSTAPGPSFTSQCLKPLTNNLLMLFLSKPIFLIFIVAVAPWSEWSECSVLCGFGVKTRTQIITENCLENCHLNETAACHPDCIGTQLSKDGDSCDKYCTNIGNF